ncbi:uncharacterized protein N7483_008576 [Penicillium malachiteum]|uniref:uncharacterized protein n=1 Tax=Penicillium malachiteum TaxID=1324776 RepID=UPI0025473918|nr:uncharacterized protein N7483_008576 [Penicillium malachiteum]KAJ5720642.1 hypothetical protein N7483_008576 [Penicillium malachiteum]
MVTNIEVTMSEYRLPIELTMQVISYLIDAGVDPAPYATVSREWQMLIEQRIFNTINLNTSKQLAAFKQIVAQNTRRKTCIRKIKLVVELEPYSIEARAEFETAEEHRRNNGIFVPAIQSLFSILKSWPENEPGINLSIEVMSPSDIVDRQRARQARKDPETDLWQRRFERNYSRHAVYINLEERSFPCMFVCQHVWSVTCFRDQHRASARDIKKLYLMFTGYAPVNQDFAPTNLQLTSLCLDYTIVGKELFWPINPTDNMKLPTWLNLIHIHLQCGMTTPSGEWLYERDPEEVEFDPNVDPEEDLPEHKMRAPEDRVSNTFRLKASPTLCNGLYMSSARAAQRMPRLKFMSIRTTEAHYELSFEYKVDGTTAKATWDCWKLFTLDEPVLKAWKNAAFQHTGVELEVQLTHWENPV